MNHIQSALSAIGGQRVRVPQLRELSAQAFFKRNANSELPADFYKAFAEVNAKHAQHFAAMEFLRKLEPAERMKLPLFEGASNDYLELIYSDIDSTLDYAVKQHAEDLAAPVVLDILFKSIDSESDLTENLTTEIKDKLNSILMAHLPRLETLLDLNADQRFCAMLSDGYNKTHLVDAFITNLSDKDKCKLIVLYTKNPNALLELRDRQNFAPLFGARQGEIESIMESHVNIATEIGTICDYEDLCRYIHFQPVGIKQRIIAYYEQNPAKLNELIDSGGLSEFISEFDALSNSMRALAVEHGYQPSSR